jgi:hypothetical protein
VAAPNAPYGELAGNTGYAAGRGLFRSSPPSNTAVRPGVGISQYLHDSRGRGRCVEVLIAASFVCLLVVLYLSSAGQPCLQARERFSIGAFLKYVPPYWPERYLLGDRNRSRELKKGLLAFFITCVSGGTLEVPCPQGEGEAEGEARSRTTDKGQGFKSERSSLSLSSPG